MSISATLDADGAETSELQIARGKTLAYTFSTSDLEFAALDLLVSYNNRGTWRTFTLAEATDDAGLAASGGAHLVNDTSSDIFAKFVLREAFVGEMDVLAGEIAVTLAVDAQTIVVLRDPATSKELIEYGDSVLRPLVPTDLSAGVTLGALTQGAALPEYADNAAALTAEAPIGSLYTDGAGGLFIVIAGA